MLSGTRLTSVAQDIWTAYVQEGDAVVDATAGNGGDTLWLARAVGPQGSVSAFDKEVVNIDCVSLMHQLWKHTYVNCRRKRWMAQQQGFGQTFQLKRCPACISITAVTP